MPTIESKLVDLTLHKHFATERAVLLSDDGSRSKAQWVPISQVEVEPLSGETVIVTMPEWLAKEKGWI